MSVSRSTPCNPPRPGTRVRQRGVVLVTGMIFLLIMTIIGITAMNNAILEEKMAGNLRDRNLAFQAAEAGLRDGADWIKNKTSVPAANTAPNPASQVWAANPAGADASRWNDTAPKASGFVLTPANGPCDGRFKEYGARGTKDLADVSQDPCIAIEEFGFVPDDLSPESLARRIGIYYYSATALGFGGTPQAQSMLQSTIKKRFN